MVKPLSSSRFALSHALTSPLTMHERLRRARLLAGFDTARAAIERFGWKPSTYRAHENGQNKFRASDSAVYARSYKVSPSWLLFGEQAPPAPQYVDAMQSKSVGAGTTLHSDTLCMAPINTPVRNDYFDLSLDMDDLNGLARRGDILRFAPVVDSRSLSDGDIVAVERRTKSGVDIYPQRVFFTHGRATLAAHPAGEAERLVFARILGKAIWLLRRLDH